jgi:hypothetical protein
MQSTSAYRLATLLALGALGCASTKIVRVDALYKQRELNRASFELKCPESDLKVTTLSAEKEREYRLVGDQEPFPLKGDSVGVSGCGQQAIYVFVGPDGWVNNTGTQKSK